MGVDLARKIKGWILTSRVAAQHRRTEKNYLEKSSLNADDADQSLMARFFRHSRGVQSLARHALRGMPGQALGKPALIGDIRARNKLTRIIGLTRSTVKTGIFPTLPSRPEKYRQRDIRPTCQLRLFDLSALPVGGKRPPR